MQLQLFAGQHTLLWSSSSPAWAELCIFTMSLSPVLVCVPVRVGETALWQIPVVDSTTTRMEFKFINQGTRQGEIVIWISL